MVEDGHPSGAVVPLVRRDQRYVLVVEDDAAQREELVALIRSFGWQTVGVEDGESAVAFIERTPPILVILDIHLPRIDGIRALQFVQSLGYGGPVVLLSGDPSAVRRAAASEARAITILEKPLPPRALGQILFSVLAEQP